MQLTIRRSESSTQSRDPPLLCQNDGQAGCSVKLPALPGSRGASGQLSLWKGPGTRDVLRLRESSDPPASLTSKFTLIFLELLEGFNDL